jgi:hypothetical protein
MKKTEAFSTNRYKFKIVITTYQTLIKFVLRTA